MNYTLEVNSSLNREILTSSLEPNAKNFTLRGNLSNENTLYTFRVLVANDVGTTLTRDRQICKSFLFFFSLVIIIPLLHMQIRQMFK